MLVTVPVPVPFFSTVKTPDPPTPANEMPTGAKPISKAVNKMIQGLFPENDGPFLYALSEYMVKFLTVGL
jgi:hypothetical protein